MHVEAQGEIVKALESSEEPMTFDEMKSSLDLRSQDLRHGLKELIKRDSGVYVDGVQDKQKRYDIK